MQSLAGSGLCHSQMGPRPLAHRHRETSVVRAALPHGFGDCDCDKRPMTAAALRAGLMLLFPTLWEIHMARCQEASGVRKLL